METRLDIYKVLIGIAVTACYCYGLYEVIEPMVVNGESWVTIFVVASFAFMAISLGLLVLAFCGGPVLAIAFFAVEGLIQLGQWATRRIRGVSAHPLP